MLQEQILQQQLLLRLENQHAAATAGDLLKAFNDALVANPGGIVSTVTGPVTVAQVLDSTDGRQLVTTKQVNALFTGVAIA
jgi:hypothetical protein